ncbi:uncharacterized protein LOC143247031 isoform X2 [Tachypleus tridentatus]|uniref:uncharacterized protein LOC143247031 isoform X2 n=1 Tax=Tachypleus tridentatus TaxID=6853 RepID=UPI003FD00B26
MCVPAGNLNCTRGYQRDVNRCYPCPPGHYDNGFQTHCLPCPKGAFMTSFAADACVACPGDKITGYVPLGFQTSSCKISLVDGRANTNFDLSYCFMISYMLSSSS